MKQYIAVIYAEDAMIRGPIPRSFSLETRVFKNPYQAIIFRKTLEKFLNQPSRERNILNIQMKLIEVLHG